MRVSVCFLATAALIGAGGCHPGSGTGGSGGSVGAGGAANTGTGGSASPGTGGTSGSSGGATGRGGSASTGTGGATGTGAAAGTGGPGAYALPPPKQCDNQFFVQGCQNGMASTTCGGVCSAASACEDISQKPNADVGFLCPRFGLQSAEMLQAAVDDFGPSPAFDYAIVGHDVDENGSTATPPAPAASATS